MSVFKNVIVYRIEAAWSQALDQMRAGPGGRSASRPAALRRRRAAGWVEPRGEEHGPLVESIGGQWLLEFMIESKTLPASVVRRKVDERCAQIEATTGRKPGKKEKKELKEDITHELLPLAFTRHARVAVWIDPAARRLVVNVEQPGARRRDRDQPGEAARGLRGGAGQHAGRAGRRDGRLAVDAGAAGGLHHRPRMRAQGDRRIEVGGALCQACAGHRGGAPAHRRRQAARRAWP